MKKKKIPVKEGVLLPALQPDQHVEHIEPEDDDSCDFTISLINPPRVPETKKKTKSTAKLSNQSLVKRRTLLGKK